MFRVTFWLVFIVPYTVFSQFTISGRILNQADTKPVANVSVFISNATIGDKTAADGSFTLRNVKQGKYELIISIVGFDTYSQSVVVDKNISLADIVIVPKSIILTEVTVKPRDDPNKEKYLTWFKDEFLGTTWRAGECKLLNPEVLDLTYDEPAQKLAGSSYDYLVIQNDALGYRIRYLLTDFELNKKDDDHQTINYKGPVQFEEMKGSPSEQRRWLKNREQVYENSPMHFFRSAVNNRLAGEGFRVQKVVKMDNPDRPSDSLINAKLKFYKLAKQNNNDINDDEAKWIAKSRLPKKLERTFTMEAKDLIKPTDQQGIYALAGDTSNLFVAYSKNHRYHVKNAPGSLSNANNDENTLIRFKTTNAFFYSNGVLINPYAVVYYGVWGKSRVAELLPVNYEPPQAGDTPGGLLKTEPNYAAKADSFLSHNNTEKAYLQFDKPYYAAGDTIYFKAYVTLGEKHELSDLSGVLHVDLINTNNKISQSIKLQLIGGLAWGDFALPDSLPKGTYRLRAYTRLMRNEGEDAFFDRVIPVGSALNTRVPESMLPAPAIVNTKPTLQFFPEGGSLVAGVTSKIAFKTECPNGPAIAVKGTVFDAEHTAVCTIASAHAGMGCFYFTPQENKTYKAELTYANGLRDTINLPPATANGISLAVNNDSIPKAVVTIKAGQSYFRMNKGKSLTLVVYNSGTVSTLNCTLDSVIVKLDVLKRHLHSGHAIVTLFSAQGEPLCERMFFVQNYDYLSLNVNSDKAIYKKKDKVNIKLNVKTRADDPSSGHFSVSVIDESKVVVNENEERTIMTDLLLTSDLKGYIEQPNYYFNNPGTKTQGDLDLVMLTHGYRHFEWKKVLDSTRRNPIFNLEKAIGIEGLVTNLAGKPVANGTVNLITANNGVLATSATDVKGLFHFDNFVFTDTAHFVLSAVNDKNRNSTRITAFNDQRNAPALLPYRQLSGSPINDSVMATYVRNAKLRQRDVANYLKGTGIILKQVNIKSKKPDDQYRTQSFAGAGGADQVLHSEELGYGPLTTKLYGLRGVFFDGATLYLTINNNATGKNYAKRMLVIVDGLEHADYKYLQANEVETVEVLRNASASIYGMEGAGGVLIITTKTNRGLEAKDITSTGVLPITVPGFYKAREFYSPKYDHPNDTRKYPDRRSTVYWKPEVITDKDGNASFDYYNADGTGNYKVTIEGIDENGNLGRLVYIYEVK